MQTNLASSLKGQSASLLYNYLEKGCAFIMSKKLTFRGHSTQTYAEVFQSFISAKTAQGVADITIRNYHNNLHVISKYLDTSRPLGELTKWDLDEMIVSMRQAGLAHNSISTYVRIVRIRSSISSRLSSHFPSSDILSPSFAVFS